MRSISTLLPRAGRPRSNEIKNRREPRKQPRRRGTALCRFAVFSVASCWFLVVIVWAGIEDKAKDNPDEAPTGFNNSTNGFEGQDAFDKDRQKFEEIEAISDGLGPVYNATSCVSCHQNPVSGSSSQVAEIRAGHHERDPDDPKKVIFVESPGGSLIHQRAINAAIQEHALPEHKVRTLRMSTN